MLLPFNVALTQCAVPLCCLCVAVCTFAMSLQRFTPYPVQEDCYFGAGFGVNMAVTITGGGIKNGKLYGGKISQGDPTICNGGVPGQNGNNTNPNSNVINNVVQQCNNECNGSINYNNCYCPCAFCADDDSLTLLSRLSSRC